MDEDTTKAAYASLRFMGIVLDPIGTTQVLRLPPDRTHRKDEPNLRRLKSGIVREYAAFPAGLWSMSSFKWVESTQLEIHLCWILDQVEPISERVKALLHDGVTAELFCYSSAPTEALPTISEQVRGGAKKLALDIVIDHYAIS